MDLWQNMLGNCIEAATARWPEPPSAEKPSPEGRSGFLFSGTQQETLSRRLLLDSRLTPLERNAWMVFKLLLDKQGFAVPRYQDLQPYLSMTPYANGASKETVARVIANLRLTRWLSLVTKGRDENTGRIQGALYILHDEPVSVGEAMQLDTNYADHVAKCCNHANKSVRSIANHAKLELEQEGHELPSRLEVLAQRMSSHLSRQPDSMLDGSDSEPGKKALVRNQKYPGSVSELGKNSLVRNRKRPGSESEPGRKAPEINAVRNPNPVQYSTVQNTDICTVLYGQREGSESKPIWPYPFNELSAADRQGIRLELESLNPELADQVLSEAVQRCQAGGIRNPGGYLRGLIKRAKAGQFRLWAGNEDPPSSSSSTPCQATPPSVPRSAIPVRSRRSDTPMELSEIARQGIAQLRALRVGSRENHHD